MPRNAQELPNWLIVATGNQSKLNAYNSYPFAKKDSLDPEKDCGEIESSSNDPMLVAWTKADTVHRSLQDIFPDEDNYLIAANDILTYFYDSPEGLETGKGRTELKKLSRFYSYIRSDQGRERFKERFKLETMAMYCNGRFYIQWKLGTGAKIPSQQISVAGETSIVGVFDALKESEVVKVFDDNSAMNMGPRVPLALLAEKYAHDLYIENDGEREPISFEMLWKLVVEGVLPYHSFLELLYGPSEKSDSGPYQVKSSGKIAGVI